MGEGPLYEIRRLAELERDLMRQLVDVRARFAAEVIRVLPPNSGDRFVGEVVRASGYPRWFVDDLRFGRHPWQRPAPDRFPEEKP